MDTLTVCKRCSGNACYEQHIDEATKTWLCMACGFTTSTVMQDNGAIVKTAVESSPELYKDLKFVDDTNLAWLPATITIPEKGMVFLDGTTAKEWTWAGVRAIKLTQEELDSKKYTEGHNFKMDMQNLKQLGQRDFMDALEYIGFFQVEM